jgi:transposase
LVVGIAADGEVLGQQRVRNDRAALLAAVGRFGDEVEVAIEATLGWEWAYDTLVEAGIDVRLANPHRVQSYRSGRRVKNDFNDCVELATMQRLGTLPESWPAPPAVRECRELVRYRHKLVAQRTSLKNQAHGVLAKLGIAVSCSDMFGPGGQQVWDRLCAHGGPIRGAYAIRIRSIRSLTTMVGAEIAELDAAIRGRYRDDPAYRALLTIPGVGPVLAAIFAAEIGDATRFSSPDRLASWCGLTPRHRESDERVRRGSITKAGSPLVRWAAVEAISRLHDGNPIKDRYLRIRDRNGGKRNIARVAAARHLIRLVYWAMRDHEVRCLTQ